MQTPVGGLQRVHTQSGCPLVNAVERRCIPSLGSLHMQDQPEGLAPGRERNLPFSPQIALPGLSRGHRQTRENREHTPPSETILLHRTSPSLEMLVAIPDAYRPVEICLRCVVEKARTFETRAAGWGRIC